MKDITTEEAVAVLAEFKKTGYHLMLCKYEGSRQRTNRALEQAIEKVLNELEKKDKIIDAMALQLSGISIWDDQKEEPLILMTEEEVKQYFERKVKDE